MLSALPLVLLTQPFHFLSAEYWLACALAFIMCELGLVSVADVHCWYLC